MKKLFYTCYFLLLLALCSVSVVLAQSDSATDTEVAQSDNAIQPEVYVTGITTNKTTYKAGETISGNISLYNGTKTGLGEVHATLTLGSNFDDANNPEIVFDTVDLGKISFAPKENKKVPFTYVIPKQVDADDVRVVVETSLPSGKLMGDGVSKPFSVFGGSAILTTTDAFIRAIETQPDNGKGRTFSLQDGLPIYKDKKPFAAEVNYEFENNTTADITVTPKITIYKQSVSTKQEAQNFSLSPITFKKGIATPVRFLIPTNIAPGVYEGAFELTDTQGVIRNEELNFRFIIQGQSAIIQSIQADKTDIRKGEQFTVHTTITAEAPDLFYYPDQSAMARHNFSVLISVKSKEGEIIAEDRQEIMAAGEPVDITSNVTARSAVNGLYATVTVLESGKQLTTQTQFLGSDIGSTDPVVSTSPVSDIQSVLGDYRVVGFLAVLILLIVVFAFLGFKRLFASTLLLTLVATGGLLGYVRNTQVALAQYQDATVGDAGGAAITGISTFFNTPIEEQVFEPGADLIVNGKTAFSNCYNRNTSAIIEIFDGNGHSSGKKSLGSWAYRSLGTNKKGQSRANHLIERHPKNFSQNFKAPMTPGRYIAKVKVTVTATHQAGSNIGGGFEVYRIAYQPYRVAAPDPCANGACNQNNNNNNDNNGRGNNNNNNAGDPGDNSANNNNNNNQAPACSGDSCPQPDPGAEIKANSAVVTPAFAARQTGTCPLYWVAGNETADSKITCTLERVGGTKVTVPNNPVSEGYPNGYPISVGRYTLECKRENPTKTPENAEMISTKQPFDGRMTKKILECKPIPSVVEI